MGAVSWWASTVGMAPDENCVLVPFPVLRWARQLRKRIERGWSSWVSTGSAGEVERRSHCDRPASGEIVEPGRQAARG